MDGFSLVELPGKKRRSVCFLVAPAIAAGCENAPLCPDYLGFSSFGGCFFLFLHFLLLITSFSESITDQA